jgi:hypothetical protein
MTSQSLELGLRVRIGLGFNRVGMRVRIIQDLHRD